MWEGKGEERAWIEDERDEDGGEINEGLCIEDAYTDTVYVLKLSRTGLNYNISERPLLRRNVSTALNAL